MGRVLLLPIQLHTIRHKAFFILYYEKYRHTKALEKTCKYVNDRKC